MSYLVIFALAVVCGFGFGSPESAETINGWNCQQLTANDVN